MSAYTQVRVVIPPAAGSSQREPGYVMAQIREVITREPGTYRSAQALIVPAKSVRPADAHTARLWQRVGNPVMAQCNRSVNEAPPCSPRQRQLESIDYQRHS